MQFFMCSCFEIDEFQIIIHWLMQQLPAKSTFLLKLPISTPQFLFSAFQTSILCFFMFMVANFLHNIWAFLTAHIIYEVWFFILSVYMLCLTQWHTCCLQLSSFGMLLAAHRIQHSEIYKDVWLLLVLPCLA